MRPKTRKAIRSRYRDIKEEPEYLEEMLKLTDGIPKVPVLVEEGRVTIGFGGT